MKILYLITRAERGGAQVHLLDLIRGFRDRCEIEVAAGEDGFLLAEARQLGVVCHIVPSLVQPVSPRMDLKALRELVSLLRRSGPDLIHAHTSKAGILGRLSGRLCSIPAVFTAHTWSFAEGTSWKWKLIGAPCERLAAFVGGPIINVSEANRELALRYRVTSPAKLVTIHNGIPDQSGDARPDPDEAPAILMVARFAPQKDHALLVEACAQLHRQFRLQFAGAGSQLPEIERKIEECGLENQVEFLGDRSDISHLLRRASVFALASNWEGFPLSILEAMRAGLPVVASDVGGVREAVINGENGFVVRRGDRSAFTKALQTLLDDETLRAQMGRRSRRLFEEHFTVEQMLRRTFDLYRKVVTAPIDQYGPVRTTKHA